MSSINAISGVNGLNRVLDTAKTSDNTQNTSNVSFKSILEGLINNTNETDNADKMANLELLTGDLDNMHDVVIAGEEADIALRLTMSIRNKALDAYTEIMRMQV